MVDSKHPWKAWIYLLPAIILLLIFTVWPIFNTVTTAFIYNEKFLPADVQVESVGEEGEEAYRFFYADAQSVKHYLSATVADNGSVHLGYVDKADDAKSIFTYNNDFGAWVVTVGEKQYFVGAKDNTDTKLFELSDANLDLIDKKEIYPAALLKKEGNASISQEIDTSVSYNLGVFKGVPEALRYVLDNGENGTLNTTNEYDKSPMLWPTKGENGFSFCIDDYGKPIKYLNVVVAEDGTASLEYSGEDRVFFDYDTEKKTWSCEVDGVLYYLGLNVEDLLCVYPLSEIDAEKAPAPATIYRQISAVGEAVEIQAKDISEDDAYRIGSHRAAEGTQTFVTTGASLTDGIMLTDDRIAGETFSKFGFNNFVTVLTDGGSDFLICLRNTFILTVITVPISTVLALLIAVALNSIKPLQRMLQTIFFLPYVTNSIAIGMVFAAMFNIVGLQTESPSVGMINIMLLGCVDAVDAILNPFIYLINCVASIFNTGLPYNVAADIGNVVVNIPIFFVNCIINGYNFVIDLFPDFFAPLQFSLIDYNLLGDKINWINQGAPEWATFATLIIYIVWNALPFKILILLGGLQSINKQYYDAAKIDSTPKWRVLTRITVPLLSPMLTYTIITSFIGGFKEYSSVVGILGDNRTVIGGGGVGGGNMNTIVGHIQNHLDAGQSNYGLAGAAALMLFAIIFVVTMINLRISKKNTHY